MWWWEQAGIELTGAREREVAAVDVGEEGGNSDRGKRGRLMGWDNGIE